MSQLTSGPLVIVVNPELPVNNVAELDRAGQGQAGRAEFASSGNGQSTHLSAELFAAMAGMKMNHVPYKGSAPALTDIMGGQTQLMFDTMLSAMPHVKAGKLRALAVTSAARSPVAPDVPTVAESGAARLRGHRLERPARAGRHAARGAGAAERRAEEGAGRART